MKPEGEKRHTERKRGKLIEMATIKLSLGNGQWREKHDFTVKFRDVKQVKSDHHHHQSLYTQPAT